MNYIEAINIRQSRRTYLTAPITSDKLNQLLSYANQYNEESGLSIQLVDHGKEAFQGFSSSYGMFSNVDSFFAMVGKTSDPHLKEKVGYYGELLVLEATKLGLGTCWIAGTYNRKKCPCTIDDGETLVLVITVGNVSEKKSFKENAIYKLAHRGTKTIEQLSTTDTHSPEWFLEGMKAVQKAPSAVNRQPVLFRYENGVVTGEATKTDSYQLIDLGIAKAHFEIGAGGKFELGNGAVFVKD